MKFMNQTPHFPTRTITSELPKSCQVFYQTRKKQLNIAITNECSTYLRQQKSLNIQVNAFSTEHNWWLCTIPLWQTTHMVSHLVRHTCSVLSHSAEPLTVSQFKYWGNSASQNMTLYITVYTPFKIPGTNRNNFSTIKYTILQSYIVHIKHPNTASPQLTQVPVYGLLIQTQFWFGDACFYLNSFSTTNSVVLSNKYGVYKL